MPGDSRALRNTTSTLGLQVFPQADLRLTLLFEEVRVRATNQRKKQAAMLGVGLDNEDGHVRLTKGKNFALVGGSEDTHKLMQETAVKINEQLDTRGKRLEDVSVREFFDICQEVRESIG